MRERDAQKLLRKLMKALATPVYDDPSGYPDTTVYQRGDYRYGEMLARFHAAMDIIDEYKKSKPYKSLKSPDTNIWDVLGSAFMAVAIHDETNPNEIHPLCMFGLIWARMFEIAQERNQPNHERRGEP